MNRHLPSIFLVGPMGAGKTTIGKLLAAELGRDFLDSDWHIEHQSGAPIPWIFEKEGEAGFRDRETRALDELTSLRGIVLATGGGAVMRHQNRVFLQRGLVVYLNANVDIQLERTKKDKNRPLLQTQNPRQTLQALYTQRHPIYMEAADIVLSSGHLLPKQMVHALILALDPFCRPSLCCLKEPS